MMFSGSWLHDAFWEAAPPRTSSSTGTTRCRSGGGGRSPLRPPGALLLSAVSLYRLRHRADPPGGDRHHPFNRGPLHRESGLHPERGHSPVEPGGGEPDPHRRAGRELRRVGHGLHRLHRRGAGLAPHRAAPGQPHLRPAAVHPPRRPLHWSGSGTSPGKVEYQLSRSIFVRGVAQYDARERDALRDDTRTGDPSSSGIPPRGSTSARAGLQERHPGDLLFAWQPNPGTVLFAGYERDVRGERLPVPGGGAAGTASS